MNPVVIRESIFLRRRLREGCFDVGGSVSRLERLISSFMFLLPEPVRLLYLAIVDIFSCRVSSMLCQCFLVSIDVDPCYFSI